MNRQDLFKALHHAISNAYNEHQAKKATAIVADIADPNKIAQVTDPKTPDSSEAVMHKEVGNIAVNGAFKQKQQNASAAMGQPLKPAASPASPTNASAPKPPSMPKAGGMGGMPKPKPLKSFMQKKEQSRLGKSPVS